MSNVDEQGVEIHGKVVRIGDEWQIYIELPKWILGNIVYDMEDLHVSPMVYIGVEIERPWNAGTTFRGHDVEELKIPIYYSRVKFEAIGKAKEVEEETE